MALYNEKGQLYLRKCIWCRSRSKSYTNEEWIWFQRNEAPDNAALQPIAFESKTLASAETCYSNIEREAIGILHGWRNVITTTLPVRSA